MFDIGNDCKCNVEESLLWCNQPGLGLRYCLATPHLMLVLYVTGPWAKSSAMWASIHSSTNVS